MDKRWRQVRIERRSNCFPTGPLLLPAIVGTGTVGNTSPALAGDDAVPPATVNRIPGQLSHM
jgi:hypothetical protein